MLQSDLGEFTILPTLPNDIHSKYGGPHTQFVANCFFFSTQGSWLPCTIIVSCTQIFVCDSEGFVIRPLLVERLMAIYQRQLADKSLTQEILLAFDLEHDLLLRGEHFVSEGYPAKPFISTLQALHNAHNRAAPIALHLNCGSSLQDFAKLKPATSYGAPLPQREDLFESCPCWREADILNIPDEEFLQRVRQMFVVYAPDRLQSASDLCRKYRKKKGGMLQHLIAKYGPEPTTQHAQAVLRAMEKEKNFSQLMTTNEKQGNVHHSVDDLLLVHRKTKVGKIVSDDVLLFPVMLLASQPSGGHGRVLLRVKPVPVIEISSSLEFPEMYNRVDEGDFWYFCNEGYVLRFSVKTESVLVFGYKHGDRVLSTWGSTRGRSSTIIGVRDSVLWVHDDGDFGATSMIGFHSRSEFERRCGWVTKENIARQISSATTILLKASDAEKPLWLHISPDVLLRRIGFAHGEKVGCFSSCTYQITGTAVVAGVSVDDPTAFYAFFVDQSTSECSRLNRCGNPEDVIRHYGWKSLGGAARVLQFRARGEPCVVL